MALAHHANRVAKITLAVVVPVDVVVVVLVVVVGGGIEVRDDTSTGRRSQLMAHADKAPS